MINPLFKQNLQMINEKLQERTDQNTSNHSPKKWKNSFQTPMPIIYINREIFSQVSTKINLLKIQMRNNSKKLLNKYLKLEIFNKQCKILLIVKKN